MHTKEMAAPINEAATKEVSQSESKPNGGNNSAAAQRRKALELLRGGPKSTLQLRRDGDILAPAARILELKRRGFDILTQWVHQATECGKVHRVAQYVLMRETGGQP